MSDLSVFVVLIDPPISVVRNKDLIRLVHTRNLIPSDNFPGGVANLDASIRLSMKVNKSFSVTALIFFSFFVQFFCLRLV